MGIETERIKNLLSQLAKIDIAEEKKAKNLADVKDKVSEHMGKIEKAQKELEASLEAARIAAEASINEKMEKSGEMKNLQMEDMLKKIKEHQEHVKEVRNNQEEMLKPHVENVQANIKAKEERARKILVKKETEQKEKLAEQNKRAEVARL